MIGRKEGVGGNGEKLLSQITKVIVGGRRDVIAANPDKLANYWRGNSFFGSGVYEAIYHLCVM